MYQVFIAQGTEGKFHQEGDATFLTIVSGQSIGETECASEAKRLAKEWLFDHPDDTIYLAEDSRVLEWLRNTAVDHWRSNYSEHTVAYISHISFLITYIIAQFFHDYGGIGMISIVAVAAFYQVLWRLKIQNQIESAVLTQLMYIGLLLVAPILSR